MQSFEVANAIQPTGMHTKVFAERCRHSIFVAHTEASGKQLPGKWKWRNSFILSTQFTLQACKGDSDPWYRNLSYEMNFSDHNHMWAPSIAWHVSIAARSYWIWWGFFLMTAHSEKRGVEQGKMGGLNGLGVGFCTSLRFSRSTLWLCKSDKR